MISLDSTKVRIPFGRVNVLDSRLNENRYESNDAGELISEWKNKSLKIKNKGITTHYRIEKQVASDKRTYSFLVILFNSKLLKERYLEGVTIGNISVVYNELMKQGVAFFSYEDFMNFGELTDTDYKNDIVTTSHVSVYSRLNDSAKSHKQIHRGCNLFNEFTNKGIQFGDRKKATPAYPFLKFYSKYLELFGNRESDSYLFASTYGITVNKDTIRTEFTVKNKKQWKRYGIENTSLESILSIDSEKIQSIMQEVIQIHLNPRTPNITKRMSKLTPDKEMLCNLIAVNLHNGLGIEQIINLTISSIESRSTRSKKRKSLMELYNLHLKETKEGETSISLTAFFDTIGWK